MTSALTPSMQQYLGIKAEYPDCIVLFRMGDFYETFFEDAVDAANILDITLTSRNRDDKNPIPMAGVPYHALHNYMTRLIEAGRKVAICEQMEDPAQARGLVRREVVRVVTPGVLLDSEMNDPSAPSHLVAVAQDERGFGVAALDASAGDFLGFFATTPADVHNALAQLHPKELLHEPALTDMLESCKALRSAPKGLWTQDIIAEQPAVFDQQPALKTAARIVLGYVQKTHRALLQTLRPMRILTAQTTMFLPQTTIRNLELLSPTGSKKTPGTLLHFLDHTQTAMGGRLLREWLLAPLTKQETIEERQDYMGAFVDSPVLRQQVRDALQGVVDLTRVLTRLAAKAGNARDLIAISKATQALQQCHQAIQTSDHKILEGLAPIPPNLSQLAQQIADVFVQNPPATTTEGGMVCSGFHEALDQAKDLAANGRNYIAEYEAKQRSLTSIPTLRVRYNRVFGYTIEVSKAQSTRVPESYERRQTLVNAERFVTRELSELGARVLNAEEEVRQIETSIFENWRQQVVDQGAQIQELADHIALMDVLTNLAHIAHTKGFCRPVLTDKQNIHIRNGRHPIVEDALPIGAFVPNDYQTDGETTTLDIITGPNMAGKSTVMRQIAIITILAQMGSWVPADAAEIGIADAVFCRVGARDELMSGQSTFMVEMTEVAEILARATGHSLVILDEIGRGTSTFDGVAIAWAMAEYIQKHIGCRTLFATHYHELTDLTRTVPQTRNLSIAIKEWGSQILFLRKLVEGPSSKSYGIHVARLAGLPDPLLERASEVLSNLEESELDVTGQPVLAQIRRPKTHRITSDQLDMFHSEDKT